MPDLTEFRDMVNPYSSHNLKGEDAFLEQLAQCLSVFKIALHKDSKQSSLAPSTRKAMQRALELYDLRLKEKRAPKANVPQESDEALFI